MRISNALAEQQTALMAAAFAGGEIRLFTGNPPSTPDQAETGTLLGVVTVGAIANAGLHFLASANALQKASEAWAFKALASGTAGWFRVVVHGDAGGNNLSALRLDGVIGTPDAPGDMNWADPTVLSGAFYTLDAFLYLIQPIGDAP